MKNFVITLFITLISFTSLAENHYNCEFSISTANSSEEKTMELNFTEPQEIAIVYYENDFKVVKRKKFKSLEKKCKQFPCGILKLTFYGKKKLNSDVNFEVTEFDKEKFYTPLSFVYKSLVVEYPTIKDGRLSFSRNFSINSKDILYHILGGTTEFKAECRLEIQ